MPCNVTITILLLSSFLFYRFPLLFSSLFFSFSVFPCLLLSSNLFSAPLFSFYSFHFSCSSTSPPHFRHHYSPLFFPLRSIFSLICPLSFFPINVYRSHTFLLLLSTSIISDLTSWISSMKKRI